MTKPGHADLMDDIYRYQRFIYNLTRKYYLFGRDKRIRSLNLSSQANLVEIGCGTGRNLIKIAKRYPTAQLYGLDASQEMLKTARAAVTRAGLADRIHLAQGLAENLTETTFGTSFHVALFSYSLSMIPDWRGAIEAAAATLLPGGTVEIVDFSDLSGLGKWGCRALTAWLKMFHVAPRIELIRAFEAQRTGVLQQLPARYAFLLTLRKEDVCL